MITKEQFRKLRANVARMDNYSFVIQVNRTRSKKLINYVARLFGDNPYQWLQRRNIYVDRLQDYRYYCVRWLDHVEKDICK